MRARAVRFLIYLITWCFFGTVLFYGVRSRLGAQNGRRWLICGCATLDCRDRILKRLAKEQFQISFSMSLDVEELGQPNRLLRAIYVAVILILGGAWAALYEHVLSDEDEPRTRGILQADR
jgi:hypothetical protein